MLSSELRDTLQQSVESDITVHQLEEWLVPRLPNFLQAPDSPNAEVIAAVELGLAELSCGIRTLEEVRDLVERALEEHASRVTYLKIGGDPSSNIES